MRQLSVVGQAEAAGLLVRLEDYAIGAHPLQPNGLQPADRAAASSRLSPAHRTLPAPAWPDLVVVLTLVGDLQARDAVVCTDGEVIGQVLASLVADGLVVDQSLAWPRARPGCWTAPRDSSPLGR
jgi:hypothetical protein